MSIRALKLSNMVSFWALILSKQATEPVCKFLGLNKIFLVKKYPRVQLSLIMMTIKSFCMAVLGAALYETSLSEYQQNMIKVTTVTVYMLCSSAGLPIR